MLISPNGFLLSFLVANLKVKGSRFLFAGSGVEAPLQSSVSSGLAFF